MKAVVIAILVLIPFASLSLHPIESMSVGDLRVQNGKLHIKIKCLEEGLGRNVSSFAKKQVSFDYDVQQFDPALTKVVESYVKTHFTVIANGQRLPMRLVTLQWLESSKASDHAVLILEISFVLPKEKALNSLQVKNALLLNYTSDQTNVLNVHYPTENAHVLIFKKGKEELSITF